MDLYLDKIDPIYGISFFIVGTGFLPLLKFCESCFMPNYDRGRTLGRNENPRNSFITKIKLVIQPNQNLLIVY